MALQTRTTRSTRPQVQPRERTDPFLSPERVRALSELRPARVVIDTLLAWGAIFAAWTLVALHPAWWTVALAIPIIGSRFYALFIIGHDGMHRRLFRARRLNDLFNDLFVFGPIGAVTRLNNKNHLLHHRHLSTTLDPDRHKHVCFGKAFRYQLLGYVTGISSVLGSAANVFLARGSKDSAGKDLPGKAATPVPREVNDELPQPGDGYTLRDLAIVGAWQIALIGGLSWLIGWWAYPVLWLAPLYVFTFLADNLRSFLEHAHAEHDALADQHRLITFASNPIERLFLSPHHMNLHSAHHLWPSIPYYNLPQADRELRQAAAGSNLVWRGSYLVFLVRYYLALPLVECLEPAPRGRDADRGETPAS